MITISGILTGQGSSYLIVSLILILGLFFWFIFRKIHLTEVLAYLFAGLLISILGFKAPQSFFSTITGVTLALGGYIVGLSFSYNFLKKMSKKSYDYSHC